MANMPQCPQCKTFYSGLDFCAKCRIADLEHQVGRLRHALLDHRADLHGYSNRPCPTCRHSAEVLGLKVPDRCARKELDDAALKREPVVTNAMVMAAQEVLAPAEIGMDVHVHLTTDKVRRAVQAAVSKT